MTSTTAQKRVALINDLSGFGRCSLTVSLPIISAMKMQGCVIPTVILSAHTAYKGVFKDDYTEKLPQFIANWEELKISFDCIYIGYLGSAAQIPIMEEFIKKFRGPKTQVVVDPVMGDGGKLYMTFPEDLAKNLKKLVVLADIITPNLTEACYCLDRPYVGDEPDDETIKQVLVDLNKMGPKHVVVTGIKRGNKLINAIYDEGEFTFIDREKLGEERHGTGDIFSSVIVGEMVRGKKLKDAVMSACLFVEKSIVYSMELGVPNKEGACFEEFLKDLAE